MSELLLRPSRLDDPHALALIAEVQAEYTDLYGGPDESPIVAEEFNPPLGLFLLGYLDDRPVAMGGWRRHGPEHRETDWAGDRAEIKRMFVTAEARRFGFARAVLAELERTAAQAGVEWLLLETGSRQPSAIALYRSAGYQDVSPFGHYADTDLSVHLGKAIRTSSGRS